MLLFRNSFDIVLGELPNHTNQIYIPVRMEMTPHMTIHVGRYIDGFPTWLRNIFLISQQIESLDSI